MRALNIAVVCVVLANLPAIGAGPEWLEPIRKVSIDKKVPLPDGLVFSNPQTAWLQWVSLPGTIIAETTMDESELKSVIEKNNIKVDELVRDSFITELRKANLFQHIGDAPADGVFHLVVETYGVDRSTFGMDLFAVVDLEAKLVDRTGKILWEAETSVDPDDEGMPNGDLEQMLQNKNDVLRKSFVEAARRVAEEAVDELKAGEGRPRRGARDSSRDNSGSESSPASSPKPGNSATRKGM